MAQSKSKQVFCTAHLERLGQQVPASELALKSGIDLCADCFAGRAIHPQEERGDHLGMNAFRAKKRDVSAVTEADAQLEKLRARGVIHIPYETTRQSRAWQARLSYQAKKRGWKLEMESNFAVQALTVRMARA